MSGPVRTAAVLELLVSRARPIPVATIVRVCGIPRSSTYEILKALVAAGFADAVPGGFCAGERTRNLAGGITIAGALSLLESFDHDTPTLTRAELYRRAELQRARVEPLLRELVSAGLLTETDEGVSLGVRVAALAARSGPLHRLRTAARPVLLHLRDVTGETANLVVRDGDEAVYLDQVESLSALRHAGWVGRRIPLDRGAAATALSGDGSVQIARDAVEVGVTALACRIVAFSGPPAAVGVTAPTARMTSHKLAVCEHALERAVFDLDAAVRPSRWERDSGASKLAAG